MVSSTKSSIEQLTDDIAAAESTINELATYSDNIESTLTVSTGIAQQTNLLALNAAIEAEQTIHHSRERAKETNVVASEADTSLSKIRDSILAINDMTLQIATAAERQSTTTEEINRNTCNIRDISHSLAKGAREQRVSCDTMVQLTRDQDQQLDKFKV